MGFFMGVYISTIFAYGPLIVSLTHRQFKSPQRGAFDGVKQRCLQAALFRGHKFAYPFCHLP